MTSLTTAISLVAADRPHRLWSIEAARGIAALLVVLFHATILMRSPSYFSLAPLGGFFEFGFAGVDFFFVLSGFIILWAHGRAIGVRTVLRGYLYKRFIRIFPLYWFVCALILLAVTVKLTRAGVEDLEVIASLLLWPHPGAPLVAVAWTLSHELLFYAAFGAMIAYRQSGTALMAAWFIGIVWTMFLGQTNSPLGVLFHPRNLEFFVGMAAAEICRRFDSMPRPQWIAILGCAIFAAAATASSHHVGEEILLAGYALGSGLIIVGATLAEMQGNLRVPAFLIMVGRASYSIYLVHYFALSIIIKGLMYTGWLALVGPTGCFLVLVSGALGAGIVLHVWVEAPLLAMFGVRNVR